MKTHRTYPASAVAFAMLLVVGASGAFGQAPLPADATQQSPQTSEVANADVDKAIERAVLYLTTRQQRDGRWLSPALDKDYPNALTALAAWTLRESGADAGDWRIARVAAAFKDRSKTRTALARACTLLLWCSLDPARYRRRIDEDVKFLIRKQLDGGGWSDAPAPEGKSDQDAEPPPPHADRITSALALLALSRAAEAGNRVGKRIWRLEEEAWRRGAGSDGGWGFAPQAPDGSMSPMQLSNGAVTGAAVASLYLIYDQRYLDVNLKFNGRFKAKCGEAVDENRAIIAAIDGGWKWLDQHFASKGIPGVLTFDDADIRLGSEPYYLYGVSRMMAASGRKRAGSLELPREIATRLVRSQGADGSWGNVYDTCFGILALANVRTPVLYEKLVYAGHEPWYTDPRDLANLTRRLSRKYGRRVAWRAVRLDDHAEDIFDAPVLLISGHAAPALDSAATARLRDFVDAGGTILATACCSRDEFTAGMRDLLTKVLPEATVGPVDENHAVWSIVEKIRPDEGLLGFSDGCRTVAFLLDAAACCVWQEDLADHYGAYFDLAANVAVYATYNRAPAGGLAPYLDWTDDVAGADESAVKLKIARLRHGGDWLIGDAAWRRRASRLARAVGLDLEVEPPTAAEKARLSGADVLWVTGHTFRSPRPAGAAEIKAFLSQGGTVVASACCGSERFDAAFQTFAAKLGGAGAWQRIPSDDPLMTGAFKPDTAESLGELVFRERLGAPPPAKPEFPILYGLREGNRWAVIYSPYDINCGVTGHTCLHCVGYRPADAAKLLTSTLLYAAYPPSEGAEATQTNDPASTQDGAAQNGAAQNGAAQNGAAQDGAVPSP